jgi:hypothetical protein
LNKELEDVREHEWSVTYPEGGLWGLIPLRNL